MSATIIDGKELSAKVLDEVKAEIKGCMIRPSIAVIQVGDNPASNSYIANKEKVCSSVGIYFRLFKFEDGTPELSIINKIKELNNDEYVNGIMVQLPLPVQYNEKRLLNTISKEFNTLYGLGVMRMLDEEGIDVSGKDVVIVGRSKLVGRPLATLMLNRDATVTTCHHLTKDLAEHTKRADILVVAAGVPNLITADMVKKGAVVIDVGINRVNDTLCGDVDTAEVAKKASYISPVPGGVGPMTVAMLVENVLTCYNAKNSK